MSSVGEGWAWVRGSVRPAGYTRDEVERIRSDAWRGRPAEDRREAALALSLFTPPESSAAERLFGLLVVVGMAVAGLAGAAGDRQVGGAILLGAAGLLAVTHVRWERRRRGLARSAALNRERHGDLPGPELEPLRPGLVAKALGVVATALFYGLGFGVIGEAIFPERDAFDVEQASLRGAFFGVAMTVLKLTLLRGEREPSVTAQGPSGPPSR